MSFFQDFTSVLIPDIITALSLSAGECYVGRRGRVPEEGLRVWVERLASDDLSGDGMQAIYHRSVAVHIVYRSLPDGLKQGDAQIELAEAHLQTLKDRYNGQQPLVLTDLVSIQAEEVEVDTDPDDYKDVESVLQINCMFKGT